MGQQQLLLLVLGVIIVGVAVVAGIGMFQAGAEESVKDEISAHLMALGSNAQQFYKKPASMDGGGGNFTNYAVPGRMAWTESCGSGTVDDATGAATVTTAGYSITTTGATSVVITASPNDYSWTATATITPYNITVDFPDPGAN